MEVNLLGSLTILKSMNIKPNFSLLGRQFGKDRHTIKKMYEGKVKKERKKKKSELDDHVEEIIRVLSIPGSSIKGAYWYIQNEYNVKCGYDNFKTFVNKHKLKNEAVKTEAHPLYETDPGKQVQVDWVESIKLKTIDGEMLEFNLFSATLGFSRFHYFEYTDFKQEPDFKRCLIHFFKKIGGLTEEVLTDNMSAIVSIKDGRKSIHPSVISFFKDLNINLKLCKVRSPQTKGKDEVSNKYAQRLYAYDGKILNKEHLLKLIDKLNDDINRQKNTRTDMPPILLFKKEKEYLASLPNIALLNSYEDEMRSCKVPSTFLIEHRGSKYSVPPYLINKIVKYKERNERLYIYYKNDLVAEHAIKNTKSINYEPSHYKNGLIGKFKDDSEIEKIAEQNLAKFKDFGD